MTIDIWGVLKCDKRTPLAVSFNFMIKCMVQQTSVHGQWWPMMISYGQWWPVMVWWCDGLMMNDGQWWSVMANDGQWSVIVSDGQWWWSLMRINEDDEAAFCLPFLKGTLIACFPPYSRCHLSKQNCCCMQCTWGCNPVVWASEVLRVAVAIRDGCFENLAGIHLKSPDVVSCVMVFRISTNFTMVSCSC